MENKKTINVIIEETKQNIVNAINESKLPVSILELIVKDLYAEVHALAVDITAKEVKEYNEAQVSV